ncbi:uncharacterized protein LOC135697643 [Ochlerotatus camptorhynchus]|uniref:uncharacterized protein LOC135697643 n=1 Tax=Ochlerotatus camptorhynchus TaxID=644619 RepID=UPI0031E0D83C
MEKYVTVVSVDDQQQQQQPPSETANRANEEVLNGGVEVINGGSSNGSDAAGAVSVVDSQFVTVLSINHGAALEGTEPELVLVYRLPGERLGFGLKFQGGTKNNEKIQRLFIQSCAENSPASRVQASWGFLREGDEILEIDGVSVTHMSRIECVKCLKESNLAIKLLVRNGEGKVQNFYDDNGDIPEKKSVPPPPPPVPPRKLNKRKMVEHQVVEPPAKQIVEIVHPPDAEVYSNLFSDDISDLISESDDTASTISTVIDKYSICSSLSSEDYTISSNPSSLELAKALKPFTLLEKEFNLEDKLENNLFTFQPSAVNIVQVEAPPVSNEYENYSIAKVDENKNYENVVIHASDHHPQNYENVTIQEVSDSQSYENVVISTSDDKSESTVYENVDLKGPPRPAPRQAAIVEPKKRAAALPVGVIPPPRQKSPKIPNMPPHLPNEFNTIQSWLQEATEVIHECVLVPNAETAKDDKRNGSNENLPRLIDFHPKVSSPLKPVNASPQPTTVTVEEVVVVTSNDRTSPEPEDPSSVVVKKCIKINATQESGEEQNYIESSSSSDDDEEKCYDLHVYSNKEEYEDYEDEEENEDRRSSDGGAFDTYSDEDGEKLGPPEIVGGGPSEAYFNYHWSTSLLPPIGEVEEEFSSLENQQSGPIVIIDTAEETLFNDSNNNQHRQQKPKFNGHHEYIPVVDEEDDPFPSVVFIDHQPEEIVPPTKIAIKHPSEEPPPIPAAHVANGEEPETNSVNSDVIIEAVESGTAVDMDAVEHEADKNQVQVAGDGLEEEKTTTTTTTNDNEPIVLEKNSTDGVVDQLASDTVDDSETMMQPEATEVGVGNMEIDTDVKELQEPDMVLMAEDDAHVTDDDVDLLAVVGDSVDSDFEELIKAQIEQLDEDNSEQIQQIHERIIVGIERSSTSSEDEERGGEQSEMLVMVQEVVSEVKKDVGEISGEIEENVPAMDIPDGSMEASTTPSTDEQHVGNNQGKHWTTTMMMMMKIMMGKTFSESKQLHH